MSTRAQFDRSADICYSVLEAVAECHDIDVVDIEEPLQETIDGDSLSRLWGERARGEDVHGELSFDYYGCRVTVTSDGDVDAELR